MLFCNEYNRFGVLKRDTDIVLKKLNNCTVRVIFKRFYYVILRQARCTMQWFDNLNRRSFIIFFAITNL